MKTLGTIELQDNSGEYHIFEIMQSGDKLLYGSFCNVGFMTHGEMEIDDCFSIDENLQALVEYLETLINEEEN